MAPREQQLDDGSVLTLAVHGALSAGERTAISALLGHKGEPWCAHLREYFDSGTRGEYEGLRWTFLVAWHGETPVSNVCTWDADGCEILGHVYTREDWRGRGIAARLFALHREVSATRGIRFSQLNVEPESFQHAFYGRQGYRDLPGLAGAMVRGELESGKGEQGDERTVAFLWRHWPRLNALAIEGRVPGGRRSLESEMLTRIYQERRKPEVRIDATGRACGLVI